MAFLFDRQVSKERSSLSVFSNRQKKSALIRLYTNPGSFYPSPSKKKKEQTKLTRILKAHI
jgi:hypothetical protein